MRAGVKLKKPCRLCFQREAVVPDRNNSGPVFRKEICRECHADRLADDLRKILGDALVREKIC